MMVLWDKEKINIKELGEYLFLDSGTLTPLLKKLESKGYIQRQRSIEDERNVIITITKLGIDLQNKAENIPLQMGQCIKIEKEDAIQLYRILYKILEQMKD